jgi:cation diffusion facilitator family transporter
MSAAGEQRVETTLQQAYRVKRRVTWVCAALNLLLAGLKLVLGFIGQSQALVADGIHSLSDLASDAMVLVVIRFARDEADEDHPYGHARFETMATLALGVLLLLVAGGITLDAAERIHDPDTLARPGFLALAGAALSIIVKEWMFWYNLRAARQLDSELMRANAWHHRSDAISSVIVLIGIAGSMAGFPWLDAVGAIGVSLLIGKIGWGLAWSGARELVDTGASAAQLAEIAEVISGVEGVEDFHDLKTRRMGQSILVDVHVLVGSQVTVSEGHMTAVRVRADLQRRCEYVSDVLIHVDPEDDEAEEACAALPSRDELLERLGRRWREAGIEVPVERVNFHYLGGAVDVEILLSLDEIDDIAEARRFSGRLVEATRKDPYVGRIEVLFR